MLDAEQINQTYLDIKNTLIFSGCFFVCKQLETETENLNNINAPFSFTDNYRFSFR